MVPTRTSAVARPGFSFANRPSEYLNGADSLVARCGGPRRARVEPSRQSAVVRMSLSAGKDMQHFSRRRTMMRIGTCLAACISGLAVVASAAPSLAKEERHLVRHLPDGGIYLSTEMNADRERSLRECNAEVAPWNNRDY